MKKYLFITFVTFLISSGIPLSAEWTSIDGKPAQWDDILKVQLKDLRPTQPAVGFDRLFYKLGRFKKDPRLKFDEYCRKMGQKGILNFSLQSMLSDPDSYDCQERIGMDRSVLKTVVIAPDENLYLTDGHHSFNAFWHMDGGGPDLPVYVRVSRDYRSFKSMDEFWEQMKVEKNVWLFDSNDYPIHVKDIPGRLGLDLATNDPYRSLMYFAKRIAWNNPSKISVPEPRFHGDNYVDIPFVEFYWEREIRDKVDLGKYNLNSKRGFAKAIKAVSQAILKLDTMDVGGSKKTPTEMGQFKNFNNREFNRIKRPGTGKIHYLIKYKKSIDAQNLLKNNPLASVH